MTEGSSHVGGEKEKNIEFLKSPLATTISITTLGISTFSILTVCRSIKLFHSA